MDAVILIGGNSRAGRSLRSALGGRPVISVVRRAAAEGEIAVGDYNAPPPSLPFANATVVNCVGTDRGTPDALNRINCEIPRLWAEAAKAGGARHFLQLSSFSVYGGAEEVREDTPLAPLTDYGRSKLCAERALATLDRPDFVVTSLRVPILIGAGTDKLAQLVGIARRTGFVPVTRAPVRRSMLSYAGLVAIMGQLIDEPVAGPIVAADPEPFTYEMLIAIARAEGLNLRRMMVPAALERLVRLAAPGIHRRMFASMMVAAEHNFVRTAPPSQRVPDVVLDYLRAQGSSRA